MVMHCPVPNESSQQMHRTVPGATIQRRYPSGSRMSLILAENFLDVVVKVQVSILEFSRPLDGLFTAIQIAQVGTSDSTFSSRSDLLYVPTLQTFLL